MNKLAVVMGGVLLLALVLPVMAEPAIVIKEHTCDMYDADGLYGTFDGTVKVETSSGVSSIVCTTKLPDGADLPRRTMFYNHVTTEGGMCGTGYGLTDRWWQTVTPGGVVTLVCQYKAH